MTTIIKISAYLLWAMIIASIAYKLKNFKTPFSDSLTPEQKKKMKQSSQERGQFYGMVYVLAFILLCVIYK